MYTSKLCPKSRSIVSNNLKTCLFLAKKPSILGLTRHDFARALWKVHLSVFSDTDFAHASVIAEVIGLHNSNISIFDDFERNVMLQEIATL